MMKRSWQKIVGMIFIGIVLPIAFAWASNVVVSEPVIISVGGRNYNLLITLNALDQLNVNDAGTNFTITSALVDGEINIDSPDGVDIGGNHNSKNIGLAFCDSTGSRLKINTKATESIVVTVTPPSDAARCSSSGGGGGGGGGGSSPSPAPAPAPAPGPAPAPAPAPVPPGEEPPEEPVEEVLEFKDVPETDKFIMPLVKLMLEKKTYKFPTTKLFGTKQIAKGSFALQIALAVSDSEHGFKEYPGLTKIRKTAATAWPDIAKNFPRGKVSRYDFYELLLAARGISKLESKTVSDLKKECKDVKKPTKNMSQVYFTAKKFGFAIKYSGGKCRLHMPFARKEAAKFAMKARAITVPSTDGTIQP